MEAFVKPIRELESYEEIEKKKREPGIITITGCMDTQKPHLIHALGEGCLRKLIVTFEEQRARELLEEYHLFEKDAVYYPAKDILFYQSDVRGNLLTVERMRALRAILENKEVTVITTFDALMNTMIPPKRLQVVDIEKMTKRLVRMGYQKEFQVESAGQFAVRGGIIDIFPLTEENPVRMELWGDEIDIIRVFDAESQKSFGEKEEVIIYPVSELVLSDTEIQAGIEAVQQEAKKVYEVYRKEMKTEEAYRLKTLSKERIEAWGELSMFEGIDAYLSYFLGEKRMQLLDYFSPQDTLLVFDELHRGVERGNSTETEFAESMERRLQRGDILPGQMKELFSVAEILGRIHKFPALALAALNNKSFGLHEKLATHISVKSVNSYGGSFELLIKELGVYIRKKYRVILLSGSRSRAQRISASSIGRVILP